MKTGSLVLRKNNWILGADQIGLVVEVDLESETCIVLWTMNSSYKLQVHSVHAIIDIEELKDVTCTSTSET